MKKEEKKLALSKTIGWPFLIALVFWDATITFMRGGKEGNPLWKSIVEYFGPYSLFFLAILALFFFYLVTKIAGRLIARFEHLPQTEEIVLTALVIAFATYDIYITLVLPYIGFLGTKTHYAIIPLLLIPVLIYSIWLDRHAK